MLPDTCSRPLNHAGVTKMPMMLPSTALMSATGSFPAARCVYTTFVDTVVGIAARTNMPMESQESSPAAASARDKPYPRAGSTPAQGYTSSNGHKSVQPQVEELL